MTTSSSRMPFIFQKLLQEPHIFCGSGSGPCDFVGAALYPVFFNAAPALKVQKYATPCGSGSRALELRITICFELVILYFYELLVGMIAACFWALTFRT